MHDIANIADLYSEPPYIIDPDRTAVPYLSRIDASREGIPRPDLAGRRVRSPGGLAVYLVDPSGYRRWIPTPMIYNRLFRNWRGIVEDVNLLDIAHRSAMTRSTMLVRGDGAEPVYIVDRGQKRRIVGSETMEKFWFNSNLIFAVRRSLLDAMACGADWA
jgi:hypothetical protein